MLWIGQQKELDKKLKQRDSFVYLDGAVCADGGTEMDIRRKIQAGASARRKMEWVMGDRHISRKLKGKLLSSCVTPVYLYDLGTIAVTAKATMENPILRNNWVRGIVGVKRVDK